MGKFISFRYPVGSTLTSLALVATFVGATPKPDTGCISPHAYSSRALRRVKVLLQLRLLELREARLDRAEAAIRHELPIDELLRETPERSEGAKPSRTETLCHPRATVVW